jgi:hypothetical protein
MPPTNSAPIRLLTRHPVLILLVFLCADIASGLEVGRFQDRCLGRYDADA